MEWISGAIGFVFGATLALVGAFARYKFTGRLNRQAWEREMQDKLRQEAEKRLQALIDAVGALRAGVRQEHIGEDAYGQAQTAYDSADAFFGSDAAADVLVAFRELLDVPDNFNAAQQEGDVQTALDAAQLITDLGDSVIDEVRRYRERAGTAA